MLTAYAWPGNVRQLESAVERAMHLAEGDALLPEHFGIAGLESSQRQEAALVRGTLEDIGQRAVAEALERFKGNIRATAKALGVSRPTLYRKLKKLGIR